MGMAKALFSLRGISKELTEAYQNWRDSIVAAHEAKNRETVARRVYDSAKDDVILRGVEGKNETERQANIAKQLVSELTALRDAGDLVSTRNMEVMLAESRVAELRAQLRLAEVHAGIKQHGTALSR